MLKYVSICCSNFSGWYLIFSQGQFKNNKREFYRKTRLITRNDLNIDWQIFYAWAQIIYNNHDKIHSLVVLPKFVEFSHRSIERISS